MDLLGSGGGEELGGVEGGKLKGSLTDKSMAMMPPAGLALSPTLSLAKWLDYIPKASPKGLSLLGSLPHAWLKL